LIVAITQMNKKLSTTAAPPASVAWQVCCAGMTARREGDQLV
jgi:hypothetical protein